MNSLLLAGTHSGCGKTSVMLALIQYLRCRQHTVSSFKAGPDFLDPFWHQAFTGQISLNLDTQMMGITECRRLFSHHLSSGYALVEGAMGLFDGRSGVGEAGSSVHLARILGIPVVLVVDAAGMSGSLVALVSGFVLQAQKAGVRINGIIANRVGSEHHAVLLGDFLNQYKLPPLLAWMSKQAPVLPQRHLGLVSPDADDLPDFSAAFKVDASALQSAWAEVGMHPLEPSDPKQRLAGKTVAVVRDAVCYFSYQGNLDWLESQGAELIFFSVLLGEPVPDTADALWLPGGYPELYAEVLSTSTSWPSIKLFIEQAKPVLAECGGMMLLGQSLQDQSGRIWPMAKILPFKVQMQDRLASLGYRQEKSGLRGHEFHHSVRHDTQIFPPAFRLSRGDPGLRYKNLRGSYIHWYFASAPDVVAGWFRNGQ